MKRFWGFVIKEFYHIFRDKRTMLVLFGIPIAQLLLFGFVVTNEIRNAEVAILDKSKDEVTLSISNKILSSGYFKLYRYLQSDAEIEQAFKEGKVKEVIVFGPNFGQELRKNNTAHLQLLADASDANTANLIVNYTTAIVVNYTQALNAQATNSMQIIPNVRMMYNEQMEGVYMFIPGIMALILILISALLTSISIVREKELGTMEVLLVSPLKPIQIIIGKVMPYVVLSFINASLIVLLGFWVFDMPVQGSVALLLGECLLYIILSLSIGIFISTSTASQQAAMFISLFALMLPSMLLSGFIYPIANMPLILQVLCQLMPPRWFIVVIKDIMLKGSGLQFVWVETLVLVGFSVFFIFLSYKKFKIRLE